MKKSLISIAILGALSNVAMAQSNVTLYGIVDAGITAERGGANGYTPYYETVRDIADPFAMGMAGTAKNLFNVANVATAQLPAGSTAGATSGTRNDNAVVYKTPSYNGFSAAVSYSLGETAGDSAAQRQIGASASYSNGGLNIGLAYNTRNNDTLLNKNFRNGHNALIAANYDFKVIKVYGAYGKDEGLNSSVLPTTNAYNTGAVASQDSTIGLLGLTAPVGDAGTVMASFTRKNDKEQFNRDADQWAVGYSYALSKRTSTYVAYAKIKNKNGAGYTVGNNTEAGTGDKAFNLGVKHSF